MMAPAFEVLQRLPGFKGTGKDRWEARCPGHEDGKASLSVGIGDDGRILLFCHAGCDLARILEAAGLELKDLFGDGHHEAAGERRMIATYDYRNAAGELSYQVIRYENKDFSQRQPDGNGGWIKNIKGLKRLPYHLPELAAAEYVFVVEGEKDVESLRKIGLVGTCNSGGVGKWSAELSQYFKMGQRVTIIPDNDTVGRRHAQQVAAALHGKVASVKILQLAGLPDKGDVSDWLQGRDPQGAAEELSLLADGAPDTPTGFHPPAHWELLDVADVENWRCAPLEWIVEPIVARGNLVFVAGDTQCGKTLMGLYAMYRLLLGGWLFGKFHIYPVRKILYLCLEDPPRRVKQRILDMRRDSRIEPGRFIVFVAPGLTVNDNLCFIWLKDFITKQGFDLVVLDTYQKATPGISSFDDVKQGPILHRLSNLTRELDVTLWIHDHYRKESGSRARKELDLSSLKGTGGKPQNADCYILMERTGDTIKVLVSSKETDQKPRFLLRVSPQGSHDEKFIYAGDLGEAAASMKALGESNRQRILESIPKDGSWTSRSFIESATALKPSAVKNHLAQLVRDGNLETNGKRGKAIGYRISHAEMSLWPNAASDTDTED